MRLKKLLAAILTVTLAGLSLTSIAAAADPVTQSVTVPVFGTSMTIDIVTDASTGEFLSATIAAGPDSTVDPSVVADFSPASTSNEHGGFEVKFTNGTAGVEIEVNVADGATTKTEVEAHAPGDASGNGVWTGDPLGNGDAVTVAYTIGTDATGQPTIEIISFNGISATTKPMTVGDDTFAMVESQSTNSHEGETMVIQKVLFYNAPIVNAKGATVQESDSVNLVITTKSEHGEVKVEVALVDPNARHDDDDDESDHHESDDDHGDDHGDDDHGGDHGSDDDHSDASQSGGSDDESHSGGGEGHDD